MASEVNNVGDNLLSRIWDVYVYVGNDVQME